METLQESDIKNLNAGDWIEMFQFIPKASINTEKLRAMIQNLLDDHQDKKKANEERMKLIRQAKEQSALPANTQPSPRIIKNLGTVINTPKYAVFYNNVHGELQFFRADELYKLRDDELIRLMNIFKVDNLGVKLKDHIYE